MGITTKVRGKILAGSNSTTQLESSGDAILSASLALTAVQTKGLNSTAQTLVAAPGAGKCISIVEIFAKYVFGTTAFTGSNALEFRYDTAGGTKVTADINASLLLSASGTNYSKTSAVITNITPRVNSPVIISVPSANPAQGDGILTIKTFYRIVVP